MRIVTKPFAMILDGFTTPTTTTAVRHAASTIKTAAVFPIMMIP